MPELYALVVRELSSCCQNVSRFCGCCLLAMICPCKQGEAINEQTIPNKKRAQASIAHAAPLWFLSSQPRRRACRGWGSKQRLAQSDKRVANARHLRFKHVMGGARKLAPLSPLKKKAKHRIIKKYDNKTESKATQNPKEMFR